MRSYQLRGLLRLAPLRDGGSAGLWGAGGRSGLTSCTQDVGASCHFREAPQTSTCCSCSSCRAMQPHALAAAGREQLLHSLGTSASAIQRRCHNAYSDARPFAAAGWTSSASIDPREADKFAALAQEWWDTQGPFAPLHRMNPVRCRFIRTAVMAERTAASGPPPPHQQYDNSYGDSSAASQTDAESFAALPPAAAAAEPLTGLRVLDVGCGGGLLSEGLARLGAEVHGVDVSEENIAVARRHAAGDPLLEKRLRYEHTPMERLVESGQQYDVVVASEVIEHVRRPHKFVAALSQLVKSDGQLVLSTLNRTLPALALAVGAAEYVLGLVPRGTHDWHRFITPEELSMMGRSAGLQLQTLSGLRYDPFRNHWSFTDDLAINYIALFSKRSFAASDDGGGSWRDEVRSPTGATQAVGLEFTKGGLKSVKSD